MNLTKTRWNYGTLKVKHFFEVSPEFFSNAAIDDEVDGGVGRQEEVVHVGQEIQNNLKAKHMRGHSNNM